MFIDQSDQTTRYSNPEDSHLPTKWFSSNLLEEDQDSDGSLILKLILERQV
jgi:hypothetical protein